MPVASKKQWKLIWSIRGKYKSESETPEGYKWVWDKEWFGKGKQEYNDLPDEVVEEAEEPETVEVREVHLREYNQLFDEKLSWKWAIRAGKRIKKWSTDRKNAKVVPNRKNPNSRPTEKIVTGAEKIKTSRTQKIAARKRKVKKGVANVKRKRSMNKRTGSMKKK